MKTRHISRDFKNEKYGLCRTVRLCFSKHFNFEPMKAILYCLQASGSGKIKIFHRNIVRKTFKHLKTINSFFSADKSFK